MLHGDFSDDDVHLPHFTARASLQVRGLVQGATTRIAEKITELQSIAAVPSDPAARRHGGDRPECPVLDDLAGCHRRSAFPNRFAPPQYGKIRA